MVSISPFGWIRLLRNAKRRVISRKFDYVYLLWPDEYTNRVPKGRPFLQSLVFPLVDFSIERFEFQIKKFAKSTKGKGLIIELPLTFHMPLGLINQIHAILKPLKENGKEIIVLAKMFTSRTYYFASIATKVLLIQGGYFDVRGISRTILFMKNGFDKLGIEFEKVAVSGFKSAFDNFAREDITPEARENIEWLLEAEHTLIADFLKETRNISDYDTLINNAPYTDKDALEHNYIDGIVNADDLPAYLLKDEKKKKVKIIRFGRMHKFLPIEKGLSRSEVIAVIPITGAISDGETTESPVPLPIPIPLVGEEQTGDLPVLRTIRQIAKDPTVVGTILLVDSPGGSSLASETMRAGLANLKKKMPVVAYFNSVSASGGYYISTPADWIVSEPGCITGSIGVLMAKISAKSFVSTNDLHPVTIKKGQRADWSNLYEPFTEEEKKVQQGQVDYSYQCFLELVAENRKKTVDEIKDLAGGRVYLGTQALENGLVDQLGSLQQAKEKVCELAKKKVEKVPLITYHPTKEGQSPLLIKDEKKIMKDLRSRLNILTKTNVWLRDFSMDYK